MAVEGKIKDESVRISAENLRYICGLNGFTVTGLAEERGCSDALLYRAAKYPEDYPSLYKWLEAILPRRKP